MALVNKQIKGLYGGVNKQPPELAYDIQVDEMINCSVSPISGVESIPEEEFLYSIPMDLEDSDYVYYLDKSDVEKWVVKISPQYNRIYFQSLTGLPQTTIYSPYLSGSKEDIEILPLADYLFIINKNKTVRMLDAITEDYTRQPIVYKVLKTSPVVTEIDSNNQYHYRNITYTISVEIDLSLFGYSGSGILTYETDTVKVDDILNTFVSKLRETRTFSYNGINYNVNIDCYKDEKSKTIHINYVRVSSPLGTTYDLYPDDTHLQIGANDDLGGTASILIRNTIDDYSKLPSDVGFEKVVKVTGLDDNDYTDFYLKCNRNGWQEYLGSKVTYKLDQDTMPLVFYRDSDGVWKRKTDYWDDRKVGDDNTVPQPSFVGKNIKDIFFFENRLGFITDSNIILSEQGSYSNFWNTTQRLLPDTDPIDLTIADKDYLSLIYAITLPSGVLLFDKNKQYILDRSNNEYLTPLSANIRIVGKYSIYEKVKPIFIEHNLFVLQKSDNSFKLLFGNINQTDLILQDISKQVKDYIKTDINEPKQITNFDNNILILFNNSAFVWTHMIDSDKIILNAFHKWEFNEKVIKLYNKDNEKLLLVTSDSIKQINFKNPTKYKNIYIRLKTFLIKNRENVGNLRDIIKLKSIIVDGYNYLLKLIYKNRNHTIACNKKKIFVLNDIHNTTIEIINDKENEKAKISTINYEVNVNNYSKSF